MPPRELGGPGLRLKVPEVLNSVEIFIPTDPPILKCRSQSPSARVAAAKVNTESKDNPRSFEMEPLIGLWMFDYPIEPVAVAGQLGPGVDELAMRAVCHNWRLRGNPIRRIDGCRINQGVGSTGRGRKLDVERTV